MNSLFTSIRSYFKSEYQGRYFGIILFELARNEPEVFGKIFNLNRSEYPTNKNSIQPNIEWGFTHQGKRARADLALIDKTGQPILLVEIKEDDISVKEKNRTQLIQYIDYARENSKNGNKIRIAYVSRYAPDENILSLIEGSKGTTYEVRFRGILKGLKSNTGTLGKLVRNYLEDIGVATYRHIDINSTEGKTLTFMTAKMLGFPHSGGLGRNNSVATISTIPDLMQKFFSNLELIGDWVRSSNKHLFPQSFTRDFISRPQYDKKSLQNALKDPNYEISHAKHGLVNFHCRGTIKTATKKSVHVELGYHIYLETHQQGNSLPEIVFYAYIGGWAGNGSFSSCSADSFPKDENQALNKFRKCLESSLKEAKKIAPVEIKDSLGKFIIPPMG